MRPRLIEWHRRGRGDDIVHFDTKGRFELHRAVRRGKTMLALFISPKEGGPGFPKAGASTAAIAKAAIAFYDSLPVAKDETRWGRFPKDKIVPLAERVRRPYHRRTDETATVSTDAATDADAAPKRGPGRPRKVAVEATETATEKPASKRRLRAPGVKSRGKAVRAKKARAKAPKASNVVEANFSNEQAAETDVAEQAAA